MMMKSKIITVLLLLLVGLSALQAQSDPEATALLKKLSAKYKAYTTTTSDFTISIHEPEAKVDIVKKGKLFLKGPKFKLQIDEIISFCDGKNIWNYLPKDKQVQVSIYDKGDGSISPEKLYSLWDKDYMYRVKDKKSVGGKAYTVIELSPVTNKNASIFKIDLTMNTTTNELVSFLIYEKNGTRTTYTVNTFVANTVYSDAFFIFDPKLNKGVELIDLR
jgi:outer membrane lipoprotein-sorting protein